MAEIYGNVGGRDHGGGQPDPDADTRRCATCGRELPLDAFQKAAHGSWRKSCRECTEARRAKGAEPPAAIDGPRGGVLSARARTVLEGELDGPMPDLVMITCREGGTPVTRSFEMEG